MSEEDEEAGEDEDGKAGDESEEVDILAAAEALESTEKSADEETPDEAAEEPEAEETTDSAADEDLTSMTVAELKARLKSAGKPVSGKKDDLIARLQE